MKFPQPPNNNLDSDKGSVPSLWFLGIEYMSPGQKEKVKKKKTWRTKRISNMPLCTTVNDSSQCYPYFPESDVQLLDPFSYSFE